MKTMRDPKRKPTHPGETLREDVLPALGLTVTEAAAQLGVTRAALSRVLNGRAGISPEMALRIEKWLGGEKHRHHFSQHPPRIPGLRPSSGLRTPRLARPCSPDEAKRNPGRSAVINFLNTAPDSGLRPTSGLLTPKPACQSLAEGMAAAGRVTPWPRYLVSDAASRSTMIGLTMKSSIPASRQASRSSL